METLAKGNLIVKTLRGQIINGCLPPGSQMPTRTKLEEQFSASPVTIQRAFDRLIREEFVNVSGKRTYVAEHPPHLSRYALVFPLHPVRDENTSRFWSALHHEAQQLGGDPSQKLPIYYDIDAHKNMPSYRKLVQEVQSQRVAGLIFVAHPFIYQGTPLVDEPDVPRIAVMSKPNFQDIPLLTLDWKSFHDKALDYVVAQGRQKVALLHSADVPATEIYSWQAGLAERDLKTHPYWIQPLSLSHPATARSCAHLLMHEGQRERPDTLIIADDNLTEHALAGLADAGVRVPQEVEVITHCNFPCPDRNVVPVKRLGYDARQVLEICIESIDAQRRGEDIPVERMVTALFEEELP